MRVSARAEPKIREAALAILQALNWHGVARAIADTNFGGFMAHEFVPTRQPLDSLRDAVKTCTV